MPRRVTACLASLLLFFGTFTAVVAQDKAADEVLKAKGLRKAGSTYVLAGEGEVQKKLNEAQALFKQMTFAIAQQQAVEQELRDAKGLIKDLTEQRIAINEQLAQFQNPNQNPAQYNQLVSTLNGVTDRLNLLRQQQAEPEAKKNAETQAARRREAFVQSVIDLRGLVDSTTQAYATLAAADEVKKAIEDAGKASKAKPTLGPSRAFLANVKLLERVEASVLTESIDLRKEGGIFWVDVTFNGKVTKGMAWDTGASDVVLPADLAAQIGLHPGKDDPVVKCHVADGSVVEARQMTIASVRVGKFTVKDVSCVVMPAEKANVPPLLGQSFQRNFSFKFNADAAKLTLSRVETPEATRPAAKTKGTTKPAGKAAGKRQSGDSQP
jgi:clan AA aspartic protease (TIGR02281 family)